MINGKKLRLYPNKTQEQVIWQMFGNSRFVWNQLVAMLQERYKNNPSLRVPYSQIRGGHEADAYVTIGALQRLEKPEIAVVAVENEDGSYRIHLRSKFKPIHGLAAKYNGGGHPLAAGAKAKDRDELAKLFHELAEEW